ncbi:SDR family oxidoreductase [Allonocardiopsis opalescens]|uniref:NAD(P)H dehydrogenase (Quinone) n=1 Tax=Allonocardiopsis opalescens TaxID=1144618 RepID=A0A2T0PZ01_9ACTN|nr:SDR family oxidoreductase [Allonocardiopsis opalescens]PRX96751.1 NAD(P)H dehydrogenase (quinone) [Allonocardiopsis opalescens]
MPAYAVTGASGPFGRLVVESLLERGVPAADIVAVARTEAKAADLARRGVEVRQADYSRPDTLPPALAGVRRLLLVSGNEPGRRLAQHRAVIDAAAAAGVERLAYTSVLRADTTANPLAPDHKATERALAASGLPATVLRNGWYIENYTDAVDRYLAHGEIVGAAGQGRVSGATRADYAAAAAAALTGDEGGTTVYELGGAPFTFTELAAAVTAVTGTEVAYRDLSAADYAAVLRATGMDAGTAEFVASIDASIARGELETGSEDLPRLLGRPATPLAEAIRAARA